MQVRNLTGILAQRIPGWIAEMRRRKASDYGAILIGVAMMGAMHASPSVLDDSTVFAAAGTPPAQATSQTRPTYEIASQVDAQTRVLAEQKQPATTPKPAAQNNQPAVQAQQPQATPAPAPAQSQPQNQQPAQNPAPAAKAPAQQSQPTTSASAPGQRAQTSARSDRPMTPAEQFIAQNADAATQSMRETAVPASVTLAQAILESDSGRSQLSTQAHNYFGIKAASQPGPAGVVNMDTWEHVGGQDITVSQPFRAYHNAEESFADHGKYLRDNSRYAEAMKHTNDPRLFAQLIQQAGYATDPAYSSKLISLMDKYNLYQYDH